MIYKYKNKEFDIETERIDAADQLYNKHSVYVDGQFLSTIFLDKYDDIDNQAEDFAIRLDTLLDELI